MRGFAFLALFVAACIATASVVLIEPQAVDSGWMIAARMSLLWVGAVALIAAMARER